MTLKNGVYLADGRYRIESLLGQGGFGITYMGYQDSLKRKVAIKEFFISNFCDRNDTTYEVISTNAKKELLGSLKNQFVKEARLIATLSNKHVVNIYDVFEENGTAYYVMEYHEGSTLEDLVNKNGALSPQDAVRYIHQVAEALAEAHSNNILHLDVKPSNIMLSKYDEAVLIDFGVSKHYDEKGNQTRLSLLGVSEGYTSAEMYNKGAAQTFDPKLDIYSLAATLYFLVTGTPPPHSQIVSSSGLNYPEDIPQVIVEAINKAMLSDAEKRPATVEEFMSLLPLNISDDKKVPLKGSGIKNYFTGKYKYVTYAVIMAIIALVVFVSMPPGKEDAYKAALDKLNSIKKSEVLMGLKEMEKLSHMNYPKAMYQVALTYGWYSDSTSISRKIALGFEYETTGDKVNRPISPEYNRKAYEIYERMLSFEDTDELLKLKAHSAYQIARYSLLANEAGKVDYEKARGYLLIAKNYALQTDDKDMLRKIEIGLKLLKDETKK